MNSIARIFCRVSIFGLFYGSIFFGVVASGQTNPPYVVVIINAENTAGADNVSVSQLRNIMLLNKKEWPNGERATPFFPSEENAHYDVVLKRFFKMNKRRLKAHWLELKQRSGTAAPTAYSSDDDMIIAVGSDVGALAIVSADAVLPKTVKILYKVD